MGFSGKGLASPEILHLIKRETERREVGWSWNILRRPVWLSWIEQG